MTVLARRRAVLGTLLALATILVATRLVPIGGYWPWAFDVALLHVLWPVVLLGAAAFLVLTGSAVHRESGDDQPFTVAVLAALVLAAACTGVLLTATAADWSVRWAVICGVVLATASLLLVIGAIRHAQLWRRWCNPSVVAEVARGRRRWSPGGPPPWGSAHCLRALEGIYADALFAAFSSKGGGLAPGDAERCLATGQAVVDHLAFPWPGAVLSEGGRKAKEQRVLRELIAVALLAGPALAADVPERVDRWTARLEPGPASIALRHIFALSRRNGAPLDGAAVRRAVGEAERLLAAVPDHEREMCATTWLALAHHAVPEGACFDVWAGAQAGGTALAVPPDEATSCDPASVAARRFLAAHYDKWGEGTPARWRAGLVGRATHTSQVAVLADRGTKERLRERWRRTRPDTRATGSWPYWAVGQATPVRRLAEGATVTFALAAALVLVLVNPRFPDPWQWNTVDHVGDRRPGHDYAASGTTAMAGSGGFLGVGTKDGFFVMSRATRVPREILGGPVLDVTAGADDSSFVVLQSNQGVSIVSLGSAFRGSLAQARDTWMATPQNPVWKVPALDPARVVASTLDDTGWLMAVKGQGVVRYPFTAGADGAVTRSRSWQQGPLSQVDLDQAEITTRGIWITLTGGGIRFADLRTLGDVADRAADTPPIRQLDADQLGRWASAIDANGALWLFAAGRGWSGPWFGQQLGKGVTLDGAGDITAARLDGSLAWLGTHSGVFAYDLDRHRMYSALDGFDVAALEPLEPAGDAGLRSVLVTGPGGLQVVEASPGSGGITFATKRIDEGAITAHSVSPDGTLIVYRVRVGASEVVRASARPFTSTATVAVDAGWTPLADPPAVTGAVSAGDRTVLNTSAGCLIYSAVAGSYADCVVSTGEGGSGRTGRASALTALSAGDNRIVAVADGRPLLLGDGATPQWRDLDPSQTAKLRQISAVRGKTVGLGAEGELLTYGTARPAPAPFGTGRATALDPSPGSGPFVGDLVGAGTAWRTTFLAGDRLVTYDGGTGRTSESRLPASTGGAGGIKQVAFLGDGTAYLLHDGRLLGTAGQALFGRGGLSFRPEEVTAVGAGLRDSVLVAGRDGRIQRYEWASATWSGQPALPNDAADPVVAVRETGVGITAVLASGAAMTLRQNGWAREDLVPDAEQTDVVSGPWRWRVKDGALRVSGANDRVRRLEPSPDGLRFLDDVVEGIDHGTDGGRVVLRTKDGPWDFGATAGRTRAGSPAGAGARTTLGTRAMQVEYQDGTIRFAAFDGGSPFEGGRPFDASTASMASADGQVFALLGARAVLARNPDALADVTGVWQLPPDVPAGATLALEQGPETVLLRATMPGGGAVVMELARAGTSRSWRPASGERTDAVSGLVAWRSTVEAPTSLRPSLRLAGRLEPIEAWWARDRSAWDRTSAAAAGDLGVVLQLTPLGLFARQGAGAAGFPPVDAWLQGGVEYRGAAREGARRLGPVFSTPDGAAQLVRAIGRRDGIIDRSPTSGSVSTGATVVVALQDDPELGSSIVLREEWGEPGPSPPARLRSTVPALATENLFRSGQFVFDRLAGAVPLPEPTGRGPAASAWLALTNCVQAGPGGCLSETVRAGDGRVGVGELSAERTPVTALRTAPEGTVLGLATGAQTMNGRTVRSLAGTGPALLWREVAPGAEGDVFRTGDEIVLDPANVAWTSRPRNRWDAVPAVSLAPAPATRS